jgi:hypothetical protein
MARRWKKIKGTVSFGVFEQMNNYLLRKMAMPFLALVCAMTNNAGAQSNSGAPAKVDVQRLAYGAYLGDACSFPQNIHSNLRQAARLMGLPEDNDYLRDFRRHKSRFADSSGFMNTVKQCYLDKGKNRSLVSDIDTEAEDLLESWRQKEIQKRAEAERQATEKERAERSRKEWSELSSRLMDGGLGQNILDRAWPLVSGQLQYRSARIIAQEASGEKIGTEYSIRYVNLLGLSQTLDVYIEIDGKTSSGDNPVSVFRITDYSDFIPPKSVNRSEVNGFIRRLTR